MSALLPTREVEKPWGRDDLPAPFAPLDEYIRVSMGTNPDMQEFWRVWDLMMLPHTG